MFQKKEEEVDGNREVENHYRAALWSMIAAGKGILAVQAPIGPDYDVIRTNIY